MAPVSSFLLSLVLPLFVHNAAAIYVLDTNISGSGFFSKWNFQTSTDLSHGFVTYISQSAAQAAGLLFAQDGNRVRISADSKTTLSPGGAGRKSVRLTSKQSWTHALFVHDLVAMPAPACGAWPALWLLGPNWPSDGEIDIVEGINYQSKNRMSLHTTAGCTFTRQSQKDNVINGQCDVSINYNAGCSVFAPSTTSYGNGFNGGKGGVYVTEWTSNWIKIWEFPRNKIPVDISNGHPNPSLSTWGTPLAFYKGGSNCKIDSHFKSMSLVLNIDFCGDWAGNTWSTDAMCKSKAPDCKTYVAENPGAFTGTQFLINSIKVYKDNGAKKREQESKSEHDEDETASIESRDLEDSVPARKTAPPSADVLAREAAYDAYMDGEEEPLMRLLEREAQMKEMAEGKEAVEAVVEARHGHGHAHAHLHRSARVANEEGMAQTDQI